MEIFALLAEPVRLRLIEILATGEHSSGQLADVAHHEFGVGRATTSHHLRILARSGFAVCRSQGPSRIYRLAPDALDQLDRAVDQLHELWDARYGWPYLADPLSPANRPMTRERFVGRGRRGRSTIPVVVEVTEDNDPWQWMGD